MSQTYDPTLPASGITTFGELYAILRDKSEALRSFFEGTVFPSNPTIGQPCYRSDLKKFFIYSGDATLGVNGWIEVFIEITGHGLDVVTAAGTKSSLTERLAVSLNDDGTLKSTVAAYQSEWITPALTFTYVNSTTFTVSGDQTDIYVQYRRVKFNYTTSSTTYSTIAAASYSTATASTTVTVNDAVIATDLSTVSYGILTSDRTKDSVPRNLALTDLTNVKSESVITDLINTEAVTTSKTEGGFLRAKDLIENSIVIAGFDCTTSTSALNTLYVSSGVGLLKQTNGSVYTYEKSATSFVIFTAGATYYLHLLSTGDWYWDTTLPTDINALPIAEITTSTAGNITEVIDKRSWAYIDIPPINLNKSNSIRINYGNGVILEADSDIAYSKQIAINDGSGNFTIKSNWDGDNSYKTSNNGAANITLNTDGVDGSIILQVASLGNAGSSITAKSLYINSSGSFLWDGGTVFTTNNSPKTATYSKLANGLILEWGMGVAVGALSSVVVTLPSTLPNRVLLAMATEAGTGSDFSIGLDGYTTSSITIYNPSSYARTANWFVLGE